MQNNISKLIVKSNLGLVQFGRMMWPELNEKEETTIRRRVERLSKKDPEKLNIGDVHKCQVIFNCSFKKIVSDEK